tara:strand:- start:1219 stop:1611 length:393 start_codon:yes stop_codon:yes gene_type:complete
MHQCSKIWRWAKGSPEKQIHNLRSFQWEHLLEQSLAGMAGENMTRDIPASIRREGLSRELQPSIRVGKSGITESLIEEIDSQLSKRTIIKIKINRGLFEKKDMDAVWNRLATETSSTLVMTRGNVGVLWR